MKNKKRRSKREILSYFTPESDKWFKEKHPIGYGFLVALGVFSFMLPLLLLIVYFVAGGDEPVGGWAILAILGCLVIGVGLFNIVAAIIRQYLGHLLTAICLGGGGLIVALSIFMIEHPHLYDIDISMYYFVTLVFLLVPLIVYFFFRLNDIEYLSGKLKRRERTLRKSMKGKKNFWWYQKIHEEFDIGPIYYLNRAFTLLYLSAAAVTLVLGFFKATIPIVCAINLLTYAATAILWVYASVMYNINSYKSPIVLLRRSSTQRIDSSVLDIFSVLFVVGVGWAEVKLCLDVFT